MMKTTDRPNWKTMRNFRVVIRETTRMPARLRRAWTGRNLEIWKAGMAPAKTPVAAAKKIGYKYIPACLVDYYNPGIHIGCWYRMFKSLVEADEAKIVLCGFGD
jgi:hypothetical protein